MSARSWRPRRRLADVVQPEKQPGTGELFANGEQLRLRVRQTLFGRCGTAAFGAQGGGELRYGAAAGTVSFGFLPHRGDGRHRRAGNAAFERAHEWGWAVSHDEVLEQGPAEQSTRHGPLSR